MKFHITFVILFSVPVCSKYTTSLFFICYIKYKIEFSISLEFRESWYGDNCHQQCIGHCRYNSTCNHVTGQCERGCAAGWTGTLCDRGFFVFFTIQNQITNHFYSKLDDDYLSKIALSFRDRHSQFQFYE